MFKLSAEKELDAQMLDSFLTKHTAEVSKRYKPLHNAYITDYPIFHAEKKPEWKPDNRIAVNFAKYIVDTMNGFFIGNPIKVVSEDEQVAQYVEFLDKYNDQDDNNAELSKLCSIFGNGYEMYYVDGAGRIGITYVSPLDGFMIYDDSVLEEPRYFVRFYRDADNVLQGSVSDHMRIRYFTRSAGVSFTEERLHGFPGVPATEYLENEERMGIFEPVLTLIHAYNKALSEKANDVDYFADAYLKVLGAMLDEEGMQNIRANRIINFPGDGVNALVVDFLQKPNGDTTQENLIDRLEKLIFQISMVANISDENFGASSGIALKYKLQAMSNLEKTKERKFASGMNRRYRLIFGHALSEVQEDDWLKLVYQFTPNFPANLLEESQIAGNLTGITSQQTQLKVLSLVENVQQEIQQIEREQDALGYDTDYPTERAAVNNDLLE